MRMVLVIQDNCEPCEDSLEVLADYIKSGEIEVCSLGNCDISGLDALEGTPALLLVDKNNEIFMKIEGGE